MHQLIIFGNAICVEMRVKSPSPNRENPTILNPEFRFMLNPIHLSSPFMIVSIRMEHPKILWLCVPC